MQQRSESPPPRPPGRPPSLRTRTRANVKVAAAKFTDEVSSGEFECIFPAPPADGRPVARIVVTIERDLDRVVAQPVRGRRAAAERAETEVDGAESDLDL